MAPRSEDVMSEIPYSPTNSSLKVGHRSLNHVEGRFSLYYLNPWSKALKSATPQVISLALSLPVVSDTVTAASSLISSYVGPVVDSCSPLVKDIRSRAGEALSDNVKAKVDLLFWLYTLDCYRNVSWTLGCI